MSQITSDELVTMSLTGGQAQQSQITTQRQDENGSSDVSQISQISQPGANDGATTTMVDADKNSSNDKPVNNDEVGNDSSQVSQISQPGANEDGTTTVVDADKNDSNDKPVENDDDDDEKSNDLSLLKRDDITLKLKATTEYNSFPFSRESSKFYFLASVEASYFEEKNRAGIDLCCIIDESSSMSGDRIKLVKETVLFVIRNLTEQDRFGIIGYGNSAHRRLELTAMDNVGKKKAEEIVSLIRASGMTALYEGLEFGIKMMMDNRNKDNSNEIASLMLFTDGQANVGPSTAVAIQKQIEGRGNNSTDYSLPCTINTFGFGNNHNESLLEALSEWGRGMYTFIENTDTIGEIFAECLGGLVSIVGRDLKIRVSSLNGVKILRCVSQGAHAGYKIEETKSCEEYTILIPDIQSEERRDLLFEVSLPKLSENCDSWSMAEISCEYHNVAKNKNEILSIIGNLNRCSNNSEIGERNDELDGQCNRILASEAMDIADKMASKGDLENARKVLSEAKSKIESSNTYVKEKKGYFKYAQNLVSDIDNVGKDLLNKKSYQSQGGKKLKMSKKAHAMQRSCHSSIYQSQIDYTNSSKCSMMEKFSNK